jgi:RimJ/RimL family protein N-acetyltransferase
VSGACGLRVALSEACGLLVGGLWALCDPSGLAGSATARLGRPHRRRWQAVARDRRVALVETARLELRPLVDDDLDALVELDGFPEVRDAIDPFREHIPDDPVERRDYERRFVGHAGFIGAVERESGRLVGWFQYELADDGSGELELGYRLRPDTWGQGLATEGAAALLADALGRPEVKRVFAHALLSNPGSLRVMEKIGMTYAGAWEYKGLPGAEYEARPAAVSGG